MLEVLLLLSGLAIIVAACVQLVLANRAYRRSAQELKALAAEPAELAVRKARLEQTLAGAEDFGRRLRRRLEELEIERADLNTRLGGERTRRRSRLYTLDRVMQSGLTLWDVVVSNADYFDALADEEYRLSWANGRTYLVAAANRSDAKRRAELKFIASQGYRIGDPERNGRL